MMRGDITTTGKWVVLFNFPWKPDLTITGKKVETFLRALAHFDAEEDADIFYSYCSKEKLVPTKRPRVPHGTLLKKD